MSFNFKDIFGISPEELDEVPRAKEIEVEKISSAVEDSNKRREERIVEDIGVLPEELKKQLEEREAELAQVKKLLEEQRTLLREQECHKFEARLNNLEQDHFQFRELSEDYKDFKKYLEKKNNNEVASIVQNLEDRCKEIIQQGAQALVEKVGSLEESLRKTESK